MLQAIPDGFVYNTDGSIKYPGTFSTQKINGDTEYQSLYTITTVCITFLRAIKSCAIVIIYTSSKYKVYTYSFLWTLSKLMTIVIIYTSSKYKVYTYSFLWTLSKLMTIVIIHTSSKYKVYTYSLVSS